MRPLSSDADTTWVRPRSPIIHAQHSNSELSIEKVCQEIARICDSDIAGFVERQRVDDVMAHLDPILPCRCVRLVLLQSKP